jgi:hypothetical protein
VLNGGSLAADGSVEEILADKTLLSRAGLI